MNIAKMMQQAKAMQDKMQVMQEKMGGVLVEGASGGGVVKVVLTCKGQCQSVTLDPSVVVANDKEILEDLLKAAINDAKAKGDAKMAEETQKMMSDLGLPPGMLGSGGLPF
jgi:hypothetical protein